MVIESLINSSYNLRKDLQPLTDLLLEEGFVEYELSIKYDWPEYVENPAPLLF